MVDAPHPTFLLRFSDTQTGAVSIGFVCEDNGNKGQQFTISAPLSRFQIMSTSNQSIAMYFGAKEHHIFYSAISSFTVFYKGSGSALFGTAYCILSTTQRNSVSHAIKSSTFSKVQPCNELSS